MLKGKKVLLKTFYRVIARCLLFTVLLLTHCFSINKIESQGMVLERLIRVNLGLNFVPFVYLPSYALLRVIFCVIITVPRSKGSPAFCTLELHVLRREILA